MRRRWVRVVPLVLGLAAPACGQAPTPLPATTEASSSSGAVTEVAGPAGSERPLLRDVAVDWGIEWTNTCGNHDAKRVILEENGSGPALFDYDLDGDLDVYLVNGATLEILAGTAPPVHNALLRNDGDRFVDVTADAGVGDSSWGFGVAVGDVDGDGDPDLYVSNFGADVFYLNRGDGRFSDATAAAGLGDPGWSQSAAFFDADGDGDLDLYVTRNLVFDATRLPNGGRPCDYRGIEVACGPVGFPPFADRLYRNDGLGTDGVPRFEDVSEAAGIHDPDPQFGLGVVAADLDGDGRTDLYVANDSGPNFLFHNTGVVREGVPVLEEIAWLSGAATQGDGRFQAGMGVDAADADGDGHPDLFVTNFSNDHNTLYRGAGSLLFRDHSYPSGLGGPSRLSMAWGTRFFDADLDGDLDLYVANGHLYPEVRTLSGETYPQADHLFMNDGDGRFEDASDRIVRAGPAVSRGIAIGDVDEDGDLDVVVLEMGDRPSLLRNEIPAGRWLRVDPRRWAAEGTGVRVFVTVGDKTQTRQVTRSGSYGSSSDPRAHFGLGDAPGRPRVEVRSADGRLVLDGLAPGFTYRLARAIAER